MPDDSADAQYRTRIIDVSLSGDDYRIRALADRQQYADPDGLAERAGISSAQWCLFGQLWPAGRILESTGLWLHSRASGAATPAVGRSSPPAGAGWRRLAT